MKVLIIIPAYNEEGNIVRVVENLRKNYPMYDYVVVNDCSTDNTLALCREHHFNVIDQRINLGLAGTFQSGMKYALLHGYDAAMQFDGDGQHRPEYIHSLEEGIKAGNDIVIGSRFVEKKKPLSMRMIGNNLIEFLILLTTGKKINDPTSGMRMYGKRVIHAMATQINMSPEPDTVSYLMRCGAKVKEVQVEMDDRIAGESYLNAWKSIQYMANACVSIVFIGLFRKRIKLEAES